MRCLRRTSRAGAALSPTSYNDEECSPVRLVPLVALRMVWFPRLRFRHCRTTGTASGLFVAALGWAISSYGFYHGHQTLWHGGSVLVVLGGIVTVLGKQLLFRVFPAVAVLVFLIPRPGLIPPPISLPPPTPTPPISQGVLAGIC